MIAWIAFLPFLGFLINGTRYAFFNSKNHDHSRDNHASHVSHGAHGPSAALVPGIIASLSIGAAFVLSVITFFKLSALPEDGRMIEQVLFSWIKIGTFNIDVAFRVDVLSTLFTLVITGVGTLIHIYSIGYMSHDETPGKFFAYLNLFCFAMLILVMGSSLPMLFFGWEGVGLCSYLLIGYWYTDIEKAKAGKKAFVTNRIGDLGFLIGMFLIFSTFGTLDFESLRQAVLTSTTQISGVTPGVLTAIALFLFIGCTGKSAQIPLYVWLPDAMAGPTPVSALIHAATMVTSGIYLIARLNFIYSLSPTALEVVAWIGALTALFAATIAVTQRDIKKVLAYSTVSQLGYMFLGCGVGAFGAGVFHVITHAFFKALLFLGAGSVIHAMHEEQDILKMGGLKSKMKWTYLTFLLGTLAICGIPPFSGFFSKDEILWKAFSSPHGSFLLWVVGAVTAVMTAFYMTRLFSLTFLGKPRFDSTHAKQEVHESPAVMTIPLMVLAGLSVVGGVLGIPHYSWLDHWLEPVIPHGHELAPGISESTEWSLMIVSVLGAVVGIAAAFYLYRSLKAAEKIKNSVNPLHQASESKWYVDEIYEATVIRPIGKLSEFAWKFFDVKVIDRIVLFFGQISMWSGRTLKEVQSGVVQTYLVALFVGLLIVAGYFIYGLVI